MSRIMINGIWYVPEITSQLDITEYEGCEYDDDEYTLVKKAILIMKLGLNQFYIHILNLLKAQETI